MKDKYKKMRMQKGVGRFQKYIDKEHYEQVQDKLTNRISNLQIQWNKKQ